MWWPSTGASSSCTPALDERIARGLIPTHARWPELEPHGVDAVWQAIRDHSAAAGRQPRPRETNLLVPEWDAWTDDAPMSLPDFTTVHERVPEEGGAG